MSEKSFAALFEAAERHGEYWTERAILAFTEELSRCMESKGISQAELAAAIGVSQPYISKVLKGNVNFTLASMTKLARAVGAVIRIQLVPVEGQQPGLPEEKPQPGPPERRPRRLRGSETAAPSEPRRRHTPDGNLSPGGRPDLLSFQGSGA